MYTQEEIVKLLDATTAAPTLQTVNKEKSDAEY